MLSCQEVTELVTDFVEGRLSFRQWLRFQLHVGMCRHCRAYLRQMRATIAALGKLPEEPLDEAAHEELMRRFDGWKR
jgi:anti-sigma factor RsiW